MKIVYFGNNLFSSCLKHLLAQGHEILRVYKNKSARNSSIIDKVCADNCIPLHSHKPSESELNQLITLGAEVFIVAEYSYLLPVTKVKYAINIHPTLLPEGRGPTPLPFLITQPKFSGITLHKIAEKFDCGDIILQSQLSQSANETLTTLMIKVHLESVNLLQRFFDNIEHYYNAARPQINHSYWPRTDVAERILDFKMSINDIDQKVKIFGHMGLLIKLDKNLWAATHIELIAYKPTAQPGHVAFEDESLLAVNALDGIVCIHKSSLSLLPT